MDDVIGVVRAGVAEAVRADFPRLELRVTWVAVPAGPGAPLWAIAAVGDPEEVAP